MLITSTEVVAFRTDPHDEMQRWTAQRKMAIVLGIVKGETSAADTARKLGLTIAEIERRKEHSFPAGEHAFWALLRFSDGLIVKPKAAYRILKAERRYAPEKEGCVRQYNSVRFVRRVESGNQLLDPLVRRAPFLSGARVPTPRVVPNIAHQSRRS